MERRVRENKSTLRYPFPDMNASMDKINESIETKFSYLQNASPRREHGATRRISTLAATQAPKRRYGEAEIIDVETRLPGGGAQNSHGGRKLCKNGLTPRAAQLKTELENNNSPPTSQRAHKKNTAERQSIYGRIKAGRNMHAYAPVAKPTYSCSYCGAKFNIKSLLCAHERTHDSDFKARFSTAADKRNSKLAPRYPCKYCDRNFNLERTLHIHQMCHCLKISPKERRTLGYTELMHEKKAPLPCFQVPATPPSPVEDTFPKVSFVPFNAMMRKPKTNAVKIAPKPKPSTKSTPQALWR